MPNSKVVPSCETRGTPVVEEAVHIHGIIASMNLSKINNS